LKLVKIGAYAGAIMACIALGGAIVPSELYVATRGWTAERFGPSAAMTKKMFIVDLRKSISHYNKQICYGTHTDEDISLLMQGYLDYHREVGESHPFASQSQSDICHKLRLPYPPPS